METNLRLSSACGAIHLLSFEYKTSYSNLYLTTASEQPVTRYRLIGAKANRGSLARASSAYLRHIHTNESRGTSKSRPD